MGSGGMGEGLPGESGGGGSPCISAQAISVPCRAAREHAARFALPSAPHLDERTFPCLLCSLRFLMAEAHGSRKLHASRQWHFAAFCIAVPVVGLTAGGSGSSSVGRLRARAHPPCSGGSCCLARGFGQNSGSFCTRGAKKSGFPRGAHVRFDADAVALAPVEGSGSCPFCALACYAPSRRWPS